MTLSETLLKLRGKKNQAQVLKDVKTLERVQRRLIRIALGMGDFSVGE